jgi:tRNA (guanine37-N1)-methyltransferase
VVDDVTKRERVLVVGAGVGPYPIEIASDTGVQEVLAVEKNPKAIDMMRENISMNDVSDCVDCVEGDICDIDINHNFERVIAAAPAADEIRQPVMDSVAEGGTLQYYTFAQDEDNGRRQFAEVDHDFTLAETTSCGEIGPSASRVCVRFESC